MDNLTHSLVGYSIGEASLGFYPEASKKFCRTFLISSVVANNFPDLDFLYAPLTRGKLGYLIHHRGHTHTIFMAVVLSAVWLSIDWLIQKRKKAKRSAKEQGWLGGIILSGFLVHIALDSLNSYGVRPFWPLDNTWHYGDSVFIVEPWIWAVLLPEIIFSKLNWLVRGLGVLLLAVALGFVWFSKGVPVSMAVLITLTTAILCAFLWKKNGKQRGIYSLGSSLAVILFFITASNITRARFYRLHEAQMPTGKIEYVALSPLPANPFCWTVFTLETQEKTYVTRRALFAPFPTWISVDHCKSRGEGSTLPLERVPASDNAQVRWLGEWEISLDKMKWYQDNNCEFATFLKFARFPYLMEWHNHLVAGDFRFDWDNRMSFAEVLIHEPPKQCPQYIPNWVAPVHRLLGRTP